MPSGAYGLGAGLVERFSCGAGPAGWRYTATRERDGSPVGGLDVVLDARGVAVRVQVETGGWLLRGGSVGGQVLWRRGDAERTALAAGFTGTSPVWALAATRLLATAEGPGRLHLVRLGDEALATTAVDEGWARTGSEQCDGLTVDRWEAADLDTGLRRVVHVAGDLVLDAPGLRLLDLQL